VEFIGFTAFSQCHSIVNVKVTMRLEVISSHLFFGAGLLRAETGPNIRVIQSDAFYGCQNLLAVVLANGLTTIEERAFSGCALMTHMEFPTTLAKIGRKGFFGCDSLSEIQFPPNLETIGQEAFSRCKSIHTVDIPGSVRTIGARAFYKCRKLATVKLHEGLRRIAVGAFHGCESISSIQIPSTVEILEKESFYYSMSLVEVELQEGLIAIEESAFARCSSLAAITIPSTVVVIRGGAFDCCESLASVEFVSRDRLIIYLGSFDGCRSLRNISVSQDMLESGPHTVTPHRKYTKHFSGCEVLTKQLGRYSILRRVASRFEDFPVHMKCYHSSTTTVDELRRTCRLNECRWHEHLIDSFGMTPFHVLLSSASCTAELLQVLIDAYPGSVLGWKDSQKRIAMDYLNNKLWSSGVKSLMNMCLQVLMVDRVSRWGCKEQLEAISGTVSKILEEEDKDERGDWLFEACNWIRQYERRGRIFQLELALWKSSMITCAGFVEGGASDRLERRVVSGASVVIPSVLAFLGDDDDDDDDNSLSSLSASLSVSELSDDDDDDNDASSNGG